MKRAQLKQRMIAKISVIDRGIAQLGYHKKQTKYAVIPNKQEDAGRWFNSLSLRSLIRLLFNAIA